MILTLGREFRNGAHRPDEVTQVVGVAITEPKLTAEAGPAAGDSPIGKGEIRGVVERTESVFARLAVSRLFVVHGVNRGPSRGVAAQTCARTAAHVVRGRALFINRPGAEERAAP